MYDNDHLDELWRRQTPPRRRCGAGCGLTLRLVLLLVLAGAVYYPRIRARLTPVQTVQLQRESSVLPDTAPNCSANPRVAAVLHTAMREQRDAVVYGCDAATLTACLGELLDARRRPGGGLRARAVSLRLAAHARCLHRAGDV